MKSREKNAQTSKSLSREGLLTAYGERSNDTASTVGQAFNLARSLAEPGRGLRAAPRLFGNRRDARISTAPSRSRLCFEALGCVYFFGGAGGLFGSSATPSKVIL